MPYFGFGHLACPMETAAGNSQHLAGFHDPHAFRQLLDRLDQLRSSRSGVSSVSPNICATFFWTLIINSAWRKRSCKRSFSRRNFSNSMACGSGFGPRLCGAKPSSSPASRCLRQVVRYEEYIPSRLNNAPTSPVPWQASTSRRIRRFSAAVNRLRLALATTSVLGISSFTLPFEFSTMPFSPPPCTLNYWKELSHYYRHRGKRILLGNKVRLICTQKKSEIVSSSMPQATKRFNQRFLAWSGVSQRE